MEKVISGRKNAKDGRQEYLVQHERGQTKLDHAGSWTYSWKDEHDLKVAKGGGELIAAYADELEVRRAANELEVRHAAGAAVLHTASGTSEQTAPTAPEIPADIATGSQPEVALLAYLQEEHPRA